MKVIFLDVDGVLNNDDTTTVTKNNFCFVDDYLVKRVKKIVDTTDAVIVLSSDWRKDAPDGDDFLMLRDKLAEFDMDILDWTGKMQFYRGWEISAWLNGAGLKYNITNYVILDDIPGDPDFLDHLDHLVHTDYHVGITDENVIEAIAILNRREN